MQQIVSKAKWLARSILWGFPIPATAEEWELPEVDEEVEAAMVEHFQRIEKAWDFLRPSFASRGYVLYEKLQTSDLQPIIESGQMSPVLGHPYGRRIYESDNAKMSLLVSIYIFSSFEL
jgi:hypothetical protein